MGDLSEWVAGRYNVYRPVECRLLRAYTNDVYVVRTPEARFVLKVYGQGWRSEAEIRYETFLAQHLAAKGARVARPIVGSNHDVVQSLKMGEQLRYGVLYEYAPGAKPQPPFAPPLYEAFGQAVARMHTFSDGFGTEHGRRPLDLDHLVDEPVALVLPLLGRSEEQDFLLGLVAQVKEGMAALASEGLDWGPIHGDATLDNLHVTADGEVVLYDFDSGGPGWRASDLQGWAAGHPLYEENWRAFLQGYSRVRRIREADLQAAPLLTVAWDIWGMQIDLQRRVLQQGQERVGAYLSERFALLRERDLTKAGPFFSSGEVSL